MGGVSNEWHAGGIIADMFLCGVVDGFLTGEKSSPFDTGAVGNSCEFRRKRSVLDRLTGGDGLPTNKTKSPMTANTSASYDATSLEAAQASLTALLTAVPVRPALTPSDRSKLAVVGDRTRPFLADALDAIQTNPEIVPRGVDVDVLTAKAEAHDNLIRLEASADQFAESVRDARMQIGNELYNIVLAMYALMGKPIVGAALKPRLEALKQRFKKYGQRKTEVEPVVTASSATKK